MLLCCLAVILVLLIFYLIKTGNTLKEGLTPVTGSKEPDGSPPGGWGGYWQSNCGCDRDEDPKLGMYKAVITVNKDGKTGLATNPNHGTYDTQCGIGPGQRVPGRPDLGAQIDPDCKVWPPSTWPCAWGGAWSSGMPLYFDKNKMYQHLPFDPTPCSKLPTSTPNASDGKDLDQPGSIVPSGIWASLKDISGAGCRGNTAHANPTVDEIKYCGVAVDENGKPIHGTPIKGSGYPCTNLITAVYGSMCKNVNTLWPGSDCSAHFDGYQQGNTPGDWLTLNNMCNWQKVGQPPGTCKGFTGCPKGTKKASDYTTCANKTCTATECCIGVEPTCDSIGTCPPGMNFKKNYQKINCVSDYGPGFPCSVMTSWCDCCEPSFKCPVDPKDSTKGDKRFCPPGTTPHDPYDPNGTGALGWTHLEGAPLVARLQKTCCKPHGGSGNTCDTFTGTCPAGQVAVKSKSVKCQGQQVCPTGSPPQDLDGMLNCTDTIVNGTYAQPTFDPTCAASDCCASADYSTYIAPITTAQKSKFSNCSSKPAPYTPPTVNPTCDTLSACPTGQQFKSGYKSISCAGDPCKDAECCDPIPQTTCSAFTCPTNWTLRANSTNINCATTTCTAAECCDPIPQTTCSAFTCPTNWTLRANSTNINCATTTCTAAECCSKNPSPPPPPPPPPPVCPADTCAGFTGCSPGTHLGSSTTQCRPTCTAADCCISNPTCDTISACPTGRQFKSNYKQIGCKGATCLDGECCDPIPQPTCSAFTCPTHSTIRPNSSGIKCAGTTCTDADCCSKNPLPTCASSKFNCPSHHHNSKKYDTRQCKNYLCNAAECCELNPTCRTMKCPAGFSSKGSSRVCKGAKCTNKECCHANPQCDTFTCTPGFVQKRTAGMITCAGSTCNNTECCDPIPKTSCCNGTSNINVHYPGMTVITFDDRGKEKQNKKNNVNSDIYQYSEYDSWSSPQQSIDYRTSNMFSAQNSANPFATTF